MSWAATAVMAGISVAGGISANKQASANAAATAKQLLQQFNVGLNNLENQAADLNNQIGMELSKASFNKLRAIGNVDTMLAEKGISGATTNRLQQNVSMQEALTKDIIMQQGEAKMTEIQNNMTSTHLQYQQGLFQNEMNRIANTKSDMEIAVSAAQAGFQGYSMYKGLEASTQAQKMATASFNRENEIAKAMGITTTSSITPFSFKDDIIANMFK